MIGVETQTVMLNIPADPGMPDSMERTIPQVAHPAFYTTQTVCMSVCCLSPEEAAKYQKLHGKQQPHFVSRQVPFQYSPDLNSV